MNATDAEELRLLVRRARMLVQSEREGGVVELPGTPVPAGARGAVGDVRSSGTSPAATAPPPPPRASTSPPPRAPQPASPPAGRPAPAPRIAPARSSDAPAVPTSDRLPPDTPTHRAASPVTDAPLPALPRAAPADPRPVPGPVPTVRPLDLPADVLAPFGDLPARVASCTKCGLCATRSVAVFGEGSPSTRLVFCGEAPGAEEDRSGRPFVGASGELLTAMIEKGLRMRREDVFILNSVKCRPPGNRTPLPDEIAACRPHLEEQLATIRPKVIVALGNPASRALLGSVEGIMKIRGRRFTGFGATIVPTFHPAYLLRTPAAKADVWKDLQLVMRILAEE